MKYVCNKCGNSFTLYEDTTLDDLFAKRIFINKDGYWHWSCAKIYRNNDGFYVEAGSKGMLVKEEPDV